MVPLNAQPKIQNKSEEMLILRNIATWFSPGLNGTIDLLPFGNQYPNIPYFPIAYEIDKSR